MPSNLWKIVNWAKEEGPVKAVERINMMVLAACMQEKVSLKNLTPNTKCSSKLEQAVRKAAESVVGRPCSI